MSTFIYRTKNIRIPHSTKLINILLCFFLFSLLFTFSLVAIFAINTLKSDKDFSSNSTLESFWHQKPIMRYYALTPSILAILSSEVGLSKTQIQILKHVSRIQDQQLQNLDQESQYIIQNPTLSLHQKNSMISDMEYNQRLNQIISTSQKHLGIVLEKSSYRVLLDWGYSHWQIEYKNHGIATLNKFPREYKVYAGQYDSRGAYYAALPDYCVKTANLNDPTCDQHGYVTGQNYDVYISYQGKSAAARVGDTGPFNNDDNYWATMLDPTPRRLFTDLPVGMPEAQAAFFENYNDGKDQYDRVVTFPTGIEVSRLVAKDIGLAPDAYDWVRVAYLWTSEWSEPTIDDTQESAEAASQPVQISTEQANGSIVHEVQIGESPLAIATAYGISMEEFLDINEMTNQSVLQPGDKLIIKAANRTAIPSWKLTATHQLPPTTTSKPTRTPEPSETHTSPSTTENSEIEEITPRDNQLENNGFTNKIPNFFRSLNPWYIIITSIVIVGFGLVIAGSFINRKQ